MTAVRRFWIEFDPRECGDARLWRGVGVTGSLAEPLPVNPRYLGVSVWRGVWYPPVNLGIGPTHDIDRRGAPCDYPPPVAPSPRRLRADANPRTKTTWWDEIPHIDGLLWPLRDMHRAERGRGMRDYASALRHACATDPTYGTLVCEALDFMIGWRPTPDEWFDPTGTRFTDQRELDEYLRAFRDYLFGNRPNPIHPPGGELLAPDE